MSKPQKFPEGWDDGRVRRVLEYYESQSDEEAAAEYDEPHQSHKSTWVEVPVELVAEVRELLARKRTG
jgi:hypothetical protein